MATSLYSCWRRASHANLLGFILLCAHSLKTAAAGCTLCSDGQAIENPNLVIDLSEPFPIKTCKDLSDNLLFVDETSALCASSLALRYLCGCPITTDDESSRCSICGVDHAPSKPKQTLEGLVEMTGVLDQPTFGLTRTCELVESSIRQYEANEAACLELPMEDIRRYCGCPGDDTETSKVCTVCPGGEVVPETIGYDIYFTFSGETISCTRATELAAATETGSATCDAIQEIGTVCGCPVPENSCELCKGGRSLVDGCDTITTPEGEAVSCKTFEARLRNLASDSSECLSLDPTYADECGCDEIEEFVPCSTICPLGEELPFPEKIIHGLEDIGIEFIGEITCGAVQRLVSGMSLNSGSCRSARLLAKLCGCKPISHNACSLCEDGSSMGAPLNTAIFNYGATPKLFPGQRNSVDPGGLYTCELTDSAFSTLYLDSDEWCYWNQLMRGDHCGCPDTTNTKALIWAQRCSGILSLLGSLLIILVVAMRSRTLKRKQNSAYKQIVLCISFFDILSSSAYVIGTSFTPKELGLSGSIGCDATCKFQAWLFQMGFTSVYYNVILCIYFLLVVKYNWTDRRFKKVAKWVHLTVCLVGFGMAAAVIPFATPDWRWCYLGRPPQTDSWLPAIFLFIIPVGSSILIMTLLTFLFVAYVRKAGQGTSQELRVNAAEGKILALIRRTMWQSLWFLAAFYAVWPIQFAAFYVPTVPENYWIYLLAAIIGPLQGLLNAIVFFHRERKSVKSFVSFCLRKCGHTVCCCCCWLRNRTWIGRTRPSLQEAQEDMTGESFRGDQQTSSLGSKRFSQVFASQLVDEFSEAELPAVVEHAMNADMLEESELDLFQSREER